MKRVMAALMAVCVFFLTACSADAPQEAEPETAEPVQAEESTPEEEAPAEENAPTEDHASEEEPEIDHESLMALYVSILEDVYYDPLSHRKRTDVIGDVEANRFAVYDIDGDGSEELIVQYTTDCMAAKEERIYDYDSGAGAVVRKFQEFPSIAYFDNGMLQAGWSHNQGLAGEALWPYTLYQYDPETDSYEQVAMVDAWDRSWSETNSNGDPFPEEADVSGSGVVYYIITGEEDVAAPVDVTEYEQWRDSWQGGAAEIEVPYKYLTEENIHSME